MVDLGQGILGTRLALLLGGFAFAAASDLKNREVTDRLWQGLVLAGLAVGAVALGSDGPVPLALWLVVGALTVEHMFPWDERLGPRLEPYANLLELAGYGAVLAAVFFVAVRYGIGPEALPIPVVAVLATVLFARALFEAGVLYGGADAKALMTAGLLLPLFPTPWLVPSHAVVPVTSVLPFAFDLLMNAALLSLAVPIAVALRNLRRGEFVLWRGFTGYSLPVSELASRFVWVRDPALGDRYSDESEIETSEDDRRRRVAATEELVRRGLRRVWVTPQIPFLVVMALGALAALLAGNLVIDLARAI